MEFLDQLRRYLDVNGDTILSQTGEHLYLSLLPVLIAFLIAVPMGWAVVTYGWLRQPVMTLSSVVYTIPSLALLLVLPVLLGTGYLDPFNVVIALSLYTWALLIRTTVDALDAVDPGVVQAATAMGYKPARRWFAVELPLALPVILAGLRVATVANISLATVAALIGVGGLGQLFTRGFVLGFYPPPIAIGLVLVVLIAVVADTLIVLIQRVVTPWDRIGSAR